MRGVARRAKSRHRKAYRERQACAISLADPPDQSVVHLRLELDAPHLDPATAALLGEPPTERRIEQMLVNRKIRDAAFRKDVLDAYDRTCAVSLSPGVGVALVFNDGHRGEALGGGPGTRACVGRKIVGDGLLQGLTFAMLLRSAGNLEMRAIRAATLAFGVLAAQALPLINIEGLAYLTMHLTAALVSPGGFGPADSDFLSDRGRAPARGKCIAIRVQPR